MKGIKEVFKHNGRTDWLLVTIYLLINLLVLLNTLLQDPIVGYDSVDHLANIRIMAEGRLPGPKESSEFFSPPLPYIIPSVLLASRIFTLETVTKIGQLINVIFSFGLTFYILKLCHLVSPLNRQLRLITLCLVGILPVYYKSLVMVRGEPPLVFFVIFSLYYGLRAFTDGIHKTDALILGASLGMAILSRQWGFFTILAIIIFGLYRMLLEPKMFIQYLRQLTIAIITAFIIGGWFYIHLIVSYGTVIAFNREPANRFALANPSRMFYLGTGSGKLFLDPVRPSFTNQFIPVFYSETWGDYWQYFTIYGRNPATNEWIYGTALETAIKENSVLGLLTNRQSFSSYLGRVNLISLYPTLLFFGGFITIFVTLRKIIQNKTKTAVDQGNFLFTLFIIFSIAGYGWFLIRYPDLGKGSTIKATYALHIFPIMAILAAQPLATLTHRWPKLLHIILISLGLVFIHNLPAMVTKYIP